jgi:hypothetical protein
LSSRGGTRRSCRCVVRLVAVGLSSSSCLACAGCSLAPNARSIPAPPVDSPLPCFKRKTEGPASTPPVRARLRFACSASLFDGRTSSLSFPPCILEQPANPHFIDTNTSTATTTATTMAMTTTTCLRRRLRGRRATASRQRQPIHPFAALLTDCRTLFFSFFFYSVSHSTFRRLAVTTTTAAIPTRLRRRPATTWTTAMTATTMAMATTRTR